MAKAMTIKHSPLFVRLLNRDHFKDSLTQVFYNERSTLNLIEILEVLSEFYMKFCVIKNEYEYPLHIFRAQQ